MSCSEPVEVLIALTTLLSGLFGEMTLKRLN
jgi:hypothetical protein